LGWRQHFTDAAPTQIVVAAKIHRRHQNHTLRDRRRKATIMPQEIADIKKVNLLKSDYLSI